MTAPELDPYHLTLELARAKDAGDAYAFRFEAQDYVMRGLDGSFESATFPWDDAILRDLTGLSLPRPDPAVRQRLGEALRKFLAEAGWKAHERAIGRALVEGRRVRITIRSAAAEMYALPWELVPLGATGQYLGAIDECLLRYEWPGTETTKADPRAKAEGGRILFAWSAAGGGVPAREHLAALRDACRGEIAFEGERDVIANATLPRLQDALARGEPARVLHVLCHGGRVASEAEAYGLIWNGGPEGTTVIDGATLAQALAPYAKTLRLVVLSACFGGGSGEPGNHLGSVAQALHRVGIEAVIASRLPLSLDASIRLTETLYSDLLQASLSAEDAFVHAREVIEKELDDIEWASLQLYARPEDGRDLRPFVLRPYRGLRAFTPRDRRFYFGRETETARMLDVLEGGARLLTVVGASGAGKSSLVMAGIVPAVVSGALGEGAFQVRMMRPGAKPCEALSAMLTSLSSGMDASFRQTTISGSDEDLIRALRKNETAFARALKERLPKGARLLLVVDQLEELASLAESAGDATSFADNLAYAIGAADFPLVVVLTVRADFLGVVLDLHRSLAERVEPSIRITLPMDRATLREVIVRPAAKVGLRIDDGVVDALLESLDDAPRSRGPLSIGDPLPVSHGSANLPLLEFALEGLWERREGSVIPWAAWQSLGGLRGALAKKADEVLEGAESDAQRGLARGIFERLVQLGDGVADTRRYATRSELESVGEGASAELDRWMEARLLTTDGVDVGVAHEALIREWETLRGWIAEGREVLTVRQELSQGSVRWAISGEPEDELWRGGRLKRASELRISGRLSLSPEEGAFLAAAERAQQAEVEAVEAQRREAFQREQRGRRRARAVAVAAALAACLMGGLGVWARREQIAATRASEMLSRERLVAKQQAMMASARELLSRNQAAFAMKVLLQVDHPESATDWADVALRALETKAPYYTMIGHTDGVSCAEPSPDGTRIATGSDDWTARVWNAAGDAPAVVLEGHRGPVLDVAWSPDGKHLATASEDKTVRIFRSDGRGDPLVLTAHEGPVRRVVWSPDGTHIATASGDATARVWRADGVGRSVLLSGHEDDVRAILWTHDGTHVVTASADGTARIWRAEGDEAPVVLGGALGGLYDVDIDASDRFLVVAAEDGTARVFDRESPESPVALRGHKSSVIAARFSPDGARIVTGSVDATARVWNREGGEALAVLQGHTLYIDSVAWSADGKTILTAAWDKSARLWNADGSGVPTVLLGHLDYVQSARFLPDGRGVVTAAKDGLAMLWKLGESGARYVRLPQPEVVWSIAFSPDGSRVVTSVGDNTARIAKADGTGAPIVLRGHTGYVHLAAFSPDGDRVITSSWDKTARVWKADGEPTEVVLRQHEGPVNAAFFSPDGKYIATACDDRIVRVWDASGQGEPRNLRGHDGKVLWVAWSPDGKRVASASSDHETRIWNADGSGEPIVLRGHTRAVTSVEWSPDGRRVVTASEDLTARVWSADGEGQPVVLHHRDGVTDAVFSLDGTRVLTSSEDSIARIWNADGSGEAMTVRGHKGIVRGVAWSPDRAHVATASEDRSARVWALDSLEAASTNDVEVLRARLEAANVDCLPRLLRRIALGETAEEANAASDACERAHGRPPVPPDAAPRLE